MPASHLSSSARVEGSGTRGLPTGPLIVTGFSKDEAIAGGVETPSALVAGPLGDYTGGQGGDRPIQGSRAAWSNGEEAMSHILDGDTLALVCSS